MTALTFELKQQYQKYNQDEINRFFLKACAYGYLEIVKYLLTSPELKQHADIHVKDDCGFRYACQYGYLELVQYLLTSPELKEHADIHADDDLGFRYACENWHFDIVQYLLSVNHENDTHFQNMEFNLNWAIDNQFDDVIIAMMNNLKNNDLMQYVECLPKIEAYDKALYEEIRNIVIEECLVNPQETSLFV